MALVYLASGLDAEYAWRQGGAAGNWSPGAADPPDIQAWLGCLKELHATGAPIRETLEAFAGYLEQRLNDELDRYVESAPRRAQVALIVFFAPGAFFVLLYPWMRALF